jgi:hypothetical protein
MQSIQRNDASFRDPAGFVFTHGDGLYRQVNQAGRQDYDLLMRSGLYESLHAKAMLIGHRQAPPPPASDPDRYTVLKPQPIPFISYPYEWCFSQLKEAALLTLDIQLEAMKHGMTLKDASAYNVQFVGYRPVHIDTLSFTRYEEGQPWQAYRQFCRHFLAPLALARYRDMRLTQLLRVHLDGVPLDLASKLLGFGSWLSLALLVHIHLHAACQKKYAASAGIPRKGRAKITARSLTALVEHLKSAVRGLRWKGGTTEWADYYANTNYSAEATAAKAAAVCEYVKRIAPKTVWDLGANVGPFSRIAAEFAQVVVAFDIDPSAIETHFLDLKSRRSERILPLLIDLSNPSAGIGWDNRERKTLRDRGPVDMVLALALVHHLAISNNTPLTHCAEFFASLGHHLVIEFIPKEDSQVKRLLASRPDIFPDYSREGFECAFSRCFEIVESTPVAGTHRVLYLMRTKGR